MDAVEASRRFELAGEAAGLLEDMGYVAVARKRGDAITIDLWKVVRGEQRTKRVDVVDSVESAQALAADCARVFDEV
jgi:hypothetical protein